jgi:uncharacterized protein (TIGR02147 family)
MKTSVFQYRSASRFLLDRVVERQKADRRFSIRKWAKEMGFPSHSLLAMILQGKRSLTLKQVPHLAKGLNLSTPEKLFFQGLIQVETARTPEEKEWCELWLSELRPASGERTRIREIDEYESIANWIHPALLALSDTRDSYANADAAAEKLGISVNEARSAIERLRSLELLRVDADGKFRATCKRMTTRDDLANRGAREYHRQSARLAVEKLETQDVSEREFQSMALSVPASRIPMAKEMIRKFRTQFSESMASEHGDRVYQMNLHFFRLTESPSAHGARKENEGAEFKPTPGEFHETVS